MTYKGIRIDVEYTSLNHMGMVHTFTTLVANIDNVHSALMDAFDRVNSLGLYKTHYISYFGDLEEKEDKKDPEIDKEALEDLRQEFKKIKWEDAEK